MTDPGRLTSGVKQAQITLLVDAEAARLTRELQAGGVQTILLKGPGLARWLYEGELRTYVDIDVLVHPEQVTAAVARLRELGYEDRFPSELERSASPHARPFVRAGTRLLRGQTLAQIPLDLHTSFHGVEADPSTVWCAVDRERESLWLGGVEVSVPGVCARTAFLALHAAAGGVAVAKPLRDLERGLARLSDDVWRDAFELACELRAEPAFVAGLALVPEGRAVIDRCGFRTRGSARAELEASGAPPVALGLERLAATKRWRDRGRLVARELAPTPDFMRFTSRLARRGPLGLGLAYLVRPASLAFQLPRAAKRVVAARRVARRANRRASR